MNKGDNSPGVASCKGPKDLVQGFTKEEPLDARANQDDGDVLRDEDESRWSDREESVAKENEEREEWQRANIKRLESKYTP